MRVPILAVSLAVLAPLHAMAGTTACLNLVELADRAVADKALPELKRLEAKASTDLACFDLKAVVRAKRARLEVDLAADPESPLRSDAERQDALMDAADNSDFWVAEERLGDLLARARRWPEAAKRYDAAIAKASRFATLTDDEKARLVKEAGAAKLLASDDAEGRRPTVLAQSSRAATDGKIGGVYSEYLRGVRPVPVPVPIQFETGSATLTSTGLQAADELSQALREQGAKDVTLAGHTDPRGTDAYNMQLSSRRLATVRNRLMAADPGMRVTLVPKGKREPFDIASLSYRPTQDEEWALDRRVEWVR